MQTIETNFHGEFPQENLQSTTVIGVAWPAEKLEISIDKQAKISEPRNVLKSIHREG